MQHKQALTAIDLTESAGGTRSQVQLGVPAASLVWLIIIILT